MQVFSLLFRSSLFKFKKNTYKFAHVRFFL